MTAYRIIEVASILVLALCLAWFVAKQSSAAGAAQQLSSQVRSLGATPVVAAPAPVVGPQGTAGQNGVSITGTRITGGHLIVAYDDGHSQDVGRVVGADGATGKDGRGITGTTVTDGHLIVAYSDHTTADLGGIVGPKGDDGRGVASESISSDYHLIVTYTDGTTSDIGALPAGPAGAQGQQGQQGAKGDKGDQGDPGPTCPTGYTPHQAVITETDGSTHQGIACVADDETTAPTTTTAGLLGG